MFTFLMYFVRFSHFAIKVSNAESVLCNAESVCEIMAYGLVFSPRRLQRVQVD